MEALIGIFAAVLIAGAHHSLSECLIVAQGMADSTIPTDVSSRPRVCAQGLGRGELFR